MEIFLIFLLLEPFCSSNWLQIFTVSAYSSSSATPCVACSSYRSHLMRQGKTECLTVLVGQQEVDPAYRKHSLIIQVFPLMGIQPGNLRTKRNRSMYNGRFCLSIETDVACVCVIKTYTLYVCCVICSFITTGGSCQLIDLKLILTLIKTLFQFKWQKQSHLTVIVFSYWMTALETHWSTAGLSCNSSNIQPATAGSLMMLVVRF